MTSPCPQADYWSAPTRCESSALGPGSFPSSSQLLKRGKLQSVILNIYLTLTLRFLSILSMGLFSKLSCTSSGSWLDWPQLSRVHQASRVLIPAFWASHQSQPPRVRCPDGCEMCHPRIQYPGHQPGTPPSCHMTCSPPGCLLGLALS